MIELGFEKRV